MVRCRTGILKVEGVALSRSVTAGSSEGDARVVSNSYVGSGSGGGLTRLGLLRTQLRIEFLASLNRVRLLSARALAAGCRIIVLAADFAVRVCKGGQDNMAWAIAAHPLVLAVAALVLYELTGGFVEGGWSWLKGLHLDKRLKLRRERHSKGKQRALF
jgi:hypothetical protein